MARPISLEAKNAKSGSYNYTNWILKYWISCDWCAATVSKTITNVFFLFLLSLINWIWFKDDKFYGRDFSIEFFACGWGVFGVRQWTSNWFLEGKINERNLHRILGLLDLVGLKGRSAIWDGNRYENPSNE